MRALFASTRGAGHFNPLLPFADSLRRSGHQVLVAGPAALAETVAPTGHEFWPFDDPPAADLGAVWARVPSLSPDEQNATVVRDVFARLEGAASLPRLRSAVDLWRPDVVVRDPSQYGSALAAELAGVPHVRVATGLASTEDMALRFAAGAIDDLRAAAGLPSDPTADRIWQSPYLTVFPATLEDPDAPAQPNTLRFRDPAWDAPAAPLPAGWWAGARSVDPIVYVTFGTVAATMPLSAGVYRAALEAVAGLPARVLMTVGHGADVDALGEIPANVHVERWVPQGDALAAASAVVCHAGSGSMIGALAAGLPLVAVPLFADQPANAARVGATGTGIVAAPEPTAIRAALRAVVDEPGYGAAARRMAAEARRQPPVDDVAGLLFQAKSAVPA